MQHPSEAAPPAGSRAEDTPAGLPTVSVVIPIWNDADPLRDVLAVLSKLTNVHEIIVGDASEGPECKDVAEAAGARVVSCPKPNRGIQMNAAVETATGDVLLFHHADTEISGAHIDSLRRTMRDASIAGGAYFRKFDPTHKRRQWMGPMVRWFNRRGTLYGDQSVFVRREFFARIGRFRELPMMEDIEFSKRLRKSARKAGQKIVLIDPPMLSSARRHKAYGSIRATVENFGAIWLYKVGVSPFWIHRHYYRKHKGRKGPPPEARAESPHATTRAERNGDAPEPAGPA